MTWDPDGWVDQLEPVVRFLNTGLAGVADPLASVANCRFWLTDRGHPAPQAGPAARDLLMDLRSALRGCLTYGSAPVPARSLTDVARRATVTLRFVPAADGSLAWALTGSSGASRYAAELLATVLRAVDDGSWDRTRICPGPGCGVAFVDTTRAGRRIWCSMARCGNRAKQTRWRSAHDPSEPAAITPHSGASG